MALDNEKKKREVAPRAGAWVEIFGKDWLTENRDVVAPRAGAWVEMQDLLDQNAALKKSLPVRERGLKWYAGGRTNDGGGVAPRAGAWVEMSYACHESIGRNCRSPCGSVG